MVSSLLMERRGSVETDERSASKPLFIRCMGSDVGNFFPMTICSEEPTVGLFLMVFEIQQQVFPSS